MDKISRDQAETEFELICDALGVSSDMSDLKGEDRDAFEMSRTKLIRAIMRGRLEVEESGLPTVVGRDGERYTFKEPTGGDLIVHGRKLSDEQKTYEIIKALTKGKAKCGSMHLADVTLLTAVVGLFTNM